jgi:hypothetical protein
MAKGAIPLRDGRIVQRNFDGFNALFTLTGKRYRRLPLTSLSRLESALFGWESGAIRSTVSNLHPL